jgi:hypothetical protein
VRVCDMAGQIADAERALEPITIDSPQLQSDRNVRWRHRGSFLVQWEDIERLDVRRINLRSGFTKVSSQLP